MRCAACGAENKTGRKFCAACGGALALACPHCAFANGPDDKFCGGCGKPLGAPAALPSAQGELRPVAVLFADLSGFTALSNRLPADEVHGLLDRFFARADAAVARYGGTVDKHIGDCVMALFGAPVAHDNDAERAVRAALDIHEGAAALARELGHDGLAAHSGIALGTVMAAETGSGVHRPYTVTGASVNLAARLADKAKAGEILLDPTLAEALGDRVATEPVGALALDGFAAPVPALRLTALAREAARPAAEAPLVGRERELAQLAAIADAAASSGRGQVVLLRGEAGIGKTRLAEAGIEAAAARGFAIVRARILDFGAERGERVAGQIAAGLIGAGAGPEERRAAIARAAAAGGGGLDRRAYLHALLDAPMPPDLAGFYDAVAPEARREGLARTLAALATEAARRRPLLVAVEDLHWADADALGAVAAVAGETARAPLVVLATARPEAERAEAWAPAGAPVVTLDLAPLAAADAERLAAGLGGAGSGRPDQAAAIVARAGGNPLFLVLLLHHARAGAATGAAIVLPPSLHGLVLARQDRLAPADRHALQVAAALGQRFRLDAVRALMGDGGYAPRGLVEAHLVRRDGDAYGFVHALVRDAVYASLTGAARRELHARAAAWFEARDKVLWAEHLDLAEHPGAAAALAAAARLEAAAYRNDRALALAERGLAAAKSPADRARIQECLGDLRLERGAIKPAREAYEAALAAAPDEAARCRAEIGLAQCLRVIDDLGGAAAALDRAEALAVRLGLALERSRLHYVRGNIRFPQGRVAECLAEHQKALDFAKAAGSVEAEIAALGGLGDANYMLGRLVSAEAMFRRCVETARAHGFGRVEVRNAPMAAMTRLLAGDGAGAAAASDAAVALAERVGAPRAEMIALHTRFIVKIEAGAIAEARAAATRAEEIAVALGARRFQAENLAFLAECARRSGDRAEARRLAENAAAIARETGPTYFGPIAVGQLAAALESGPARDAALAEAEAMLAAGAVSHNHILFRRAAIEDALERGEWAAARRHADALDAFIAAEPFPWAAFFVDWGRALAEHGAGGRVPDGRWAELRARAISLGLAVAAARLPAG